MSRPRLGTMILGGCTGCHLSLLDAHEGLLDLLDAVELVHSPFTLGDEIAECDILLVEGAVSTVHDEAVAKAAREKAGTLVAVGSCAVLGGVGGLRNLLRASAVLERVYGDEPPADDLPRLAPTVRRLSDVVHVDAEIPGCSPPTAVILAAVSALLAGEMPEDPRRNLCAECGRVHETMLHSSREFVSDSVSALMELDDIDTTRCFLEQGVICMGPMTRSGCGARCTEANVPCRGCTGPSRREFEQGAKMIDALGAVLPAGGLMFMDDLVGTGYRFSMPSSVIPALVEGGEGDE